MTTPDFSPSAEQNKQPILDKLLQLLPAQGVALEIASGTGQHAAWFARHLSGWTWQPSEAQLDSLSSIRAHVAQAAVSNVRQPLLLDVCANEWLPSQTTAAEPERFDLIFCANMLHISPPDTGAALMRGSARHLAPGGRLITYGPYFENAVVSAKSNLAFDESLRARNPAWGVRLREDLERTAEGFGLHLAERHPMPANNLLLVWSATPRHRQAESLYL
jgi:SAM-dependent methyltransferase